jgi:uncharacterized membrane protein
MADFTDTTPVNVDVATVFDYLSDVSNLPHYFARMTEATPGDGEEVHTKAAMPDGQEVAGDAWFRVDDQAKTIEWGSEGASDYHGKVTVRSAEDGSEVEVHLHTERVSADDDEAQQGIRETLSNVKRLVEGQ